jgi:hypothetical protein
MTEPMTPIQVAQLNTSSPLAAEVRLGDRMRQAETLTLPGRCASGHIRIGTNPNDTDTLTLAVGPVSVDGALRLGKGVVFEYEVAGGAQPENTLIVRGATAVLTATATAAAIRSALGGHLSATVHPTDTTVIDLVCLTPGAPLTLASASGGRVLVQDNGEELEEVRYGVFVLRRLLTAEDVTRARVVVPTGLQGTPYYTLRFLSALGVTIDYNGAATMSGGVIEVPQGTAAGVWAAATVLEVVAFGLR